jgi:hypothetical protein
LLRHLSDGRNLRSCAGWRERRLEAERQRDPHLGASLLLVHVVEILELLTQLVELTELIRLPELSPQQSSTSSLKTRAAAERADPANLAVIGAHEALRRIPAGVDRAIGHRLPLALK